MSPGLQDHRAVRAALVREGMDVAAAPVIEMAALIRVPPLRHHRVLAAFVAEIGARLARHLHSLGALVERFGVLASFLQSRRRHELLEIVRCVDDHQHARPAVHHLLEPFRKQGDMEHHHHVGRAHRLERAFALPDRWHADLGP